MRKSSSGLQLGGPLPLLPAASLGSAQENFHARAHHCVVGCLTCLGLASSTCTCVGFSRVQLSKEVTLVSFELQGER